MQATIPYKKFTANGINYTVGCYIVEVKEKSKVYKFFSQVNDQPYTFKVTVDSVDGYPMPSDHVLNEYIDREIQAELELLTAEA